MQYTFRKGNHRPTFSFPWLHFGRTTLTVTVCFSASAWYEDPDPERDWNKLVGWSYGFLPFRTATGWKPAHHWNSVRLAYRPALEEGWMEIAHYSYTEGVRRIHPLYKIPVEQSKTLELYNGYATPSWGYTLSPFHGGTFPAPQDYTITLS